MHRYLKLLLGQEWATIIGLLMNADANWHRFRLRQQEAKIVHANDIVSMTDVANSSHSWFPLIKESISALTAPYPTYWFRGHSDCLTETESGIC